jgi:excisionase family DNA binding protein
MLQSDRIMLITVSPAAKILKTSEGTVRALARRRVLPSTRTSTGLRLFEKADVERVARDRAKSHTTSRSPEAA